MDKVEDATIIDELREARAKKKRAASSAPNAAVLYLPQPSNPMAVARIFAATELTHVDGLTLRYWRGSWWEWTGPHWRELHPRHIRGRLYRFTEHAVYITDKENPWAPTQRKIADLLEALGAVCFLPDAVEAPSWLDHRNSGLVVACANGLLDIENRSLAAHTPLFFNIVSTSVDYLADAKPPTRWIGFLDALWPDLECGERERAECAVLASGSAMCSRADRHPSHPADGGTNTRRQGRHRPRPRHFGRERQRGRTDAFEPCRRVRAGPAARQTACHHLRRAHGQDEQQRRGGAAAVDLRRGHAHRQRKYREQWTGRLPTRLHVVSNELPRLGDASAAIIGRFLVLLATESWLGREDLTLEPALHEERSGILSWALDGLTRLSQNGWRFTPNPASDDAITQLRDLAAPVAAFVRDRCVIDPDEEVLIDTLYGDWGTWCQNNGQTKTTRQTFGRDLKAAYPMIKVRQPRVGDDRPRFYVGIGLRAATV